MKINFKKSLCGFIALFTFLIVGSLSAKHPTVGEKVNDVIEKTEKTADAAKDKVEECAKEVKEKAEETTVGQKIDHAIDTVEKMATDAKDKVKELAHDAKEKIKEKFED